MARRPRQPARLPDAKRARSRAGARRGDRSSQRARPLLALLLAVGLASATLLTYSGVGSFGYVSYDDPQYVVDNPRVRGGLHLESLYWAFAGFHFANWHPLTWLSLMLDQELFGADPGAQHRVNVLLHLLNTLLLFAGLRAWTACPWRSAFAAALFALHPLHVESVAWISARKDLLSTLLGLLSLGAYGAFAQRRTRGRTHAARRAYALCFLLLALGLMAKPMLVTWPFVFLLADLWPLGRVPLRAALRPADLRPLLAEKLPFLGLSLLSGVLTFLAQQQEGSVISMQELPLAARLAHAPLAYLGYLVSTLWPFGLVPFYPHASGDVPWLPTVGALGLLVGLTLLVARAAPRRPYLGVGWLFYLGTLVPVIGIVQVGGQAMADRYAYVPLIGLFVMASWGIGDWVEGRPAARKAVAFVGASALFGLAWLSHLQLQHWRDSLSLFRHTLAHTETNPVAHVHLAAALQEERRFDEAIQHYRRSLSLRRDDAYAWTGLGNALLQTGDRDEARRAFEAALGVQPDFAAAFIGLGNYHMMARDAAAAYAAFRRALDLDPESADAHNNAGAALAAGGDLQAALRHFEAALLLRPGDPEALRNLSAAREKLDRISAPP